MRTFLEGTAHKERDDVGGPPSVRSRPLLRSANDGAERAAQRNHGSRTNAIAGGVLHQEARHCRHWTGEQVRFVPSGVIMRLVVSLCGTESGNAA